MTGIKTIAREYIKLINERKLDEIFQRLFDPAIQYVTASGAEFQGEQEVRDMLGALTGNLTDVLWTVQTVKELGRGPKETVVEVEFELSWSDALGKQVQAQRMWMYIDEKNEKVLRLHVQDDQDMAVLVAQAGRQPSEDAAKPTTTAASRAAEPPSYKIDSIKSIMQLDPAVASAVHHIWDFLLCTHALPERADCIFALGSNDIRVAERAAELYKEGRAPLVIMAGGVGPLTKGMFGDDSEAEVFARIAEAQGVPRSAMILEETSTNLQENITNTLKLFAKRKLALPQTVIAVQTPFMGKGTLATVARHWAPSLDVGALTVTSPTIPLETYPTREFPLHLVINAMCGVLQRLRVHGPAPVGRDVQAYTDVPDAIWRDLRLVTFAGFTNHLIGSQGAWEGLEGVP